MAKKVFEGGFDGFTLTPEAQQNVTYKVDGETLNLPKSSYIQDADITRDGADLVLEGPDGTITIEGYFAAETAPTLVGPEGTTLTPKLVNSFTNSGPKYASVDSMTDESPVGEIQEVTGDVTITRTNGMVEDVEIGTPVYQGDIIDTGVDGAANITFIDETNFAISEDARLSIDEYTFDPSSNEGTTDFSVLKGIFVFTSGLIGREDPDDVTIDTPMGSIGIRGTIIAGDANDGEITVVEGAIVLKDFNGNEVTLANQFETAKFDPQAGTIEHKGTLSADDVSVKFSGVAGVSGDLFSSIQDAANDGRTGTNNDVKGEGEKDLEGKEPATEDKPTEGEHKDHAEPKHDEARPEEGKEAPAEEGKDAKDAPAEEGAKDGHKEGPQEGQPEVKSEVQGENNQPRSMPNVMEARANMMEAKLMGNNGSGNEMMMEMKAAREATQEMQEVMNETATEPGPENQGPEGEFNGPQDTTTNEPPAWIPPQGPENQAPHLVDASNRAPDGFFASSENMTWSYDFKNEFADPDGPNGALTYSYQGVGSFDSYLSSAADLTDGVLTLNFANNTNVDKDSAALPLQFEITATDGNGLSTTHTVDFAYHGANAMSSATSLSYDSGTPGLPSSNTLTPYAYEDTYQQGSFNTIRVHAGKAKLFFGDGNNTVWLENFDPADYLPWASAGDAHSGDKNTIYMGDGDNTVHIKENADGNTVYGGADEDTFNIENVADSGSYHTELYGMGGNDTFKLDLDEMSDTDFTSGTIIDGGNQGDDPDYPLSWAQEWVKGVDEASFMGGDGDTLKFDGTGLDFFDFANISNDTNIQNIETLDTKSSPGMQYLTLSYDDIVAMTDDNNTLVIRIGSGDSLNVNDMLSNGMSKVTDENSGSWGEFSYDDGGGNVNYEVWSNGDVTLLVDNQAAGGSAVTVA